MLKKKRRHAFSIFFAETVDYLHSGLNTLNKRSVKRRFVYCYDQCQYFSQSSLPGFFIFNGVSFRNYLLPTMLLPNISLVPAQGKTLPKESLQLSRKRFSSRIKKGNVTVITFPCFSRTMSDADNLLFMLFHNLLLRNEGKRRRAYFGTTLVVQ
jgi:hypothetical protein